MAKEPEKQPASKPAPEKAPEAKFTLDKLRENCSALFGVEEPVFIGATTELAADGEYTVSEIKATIKAWMKGEAK